MLARMKMENIALVHLPKINFKQWRLGMGLSVLKMIVNTCLAIIIEVSYPICVKIAIKLYSIFRSNPASNSPGIVFSAD